MIEGLYRFLREPRARLIAGAVVVVIVLAAAYVIYQILIPQRGVLPLPPAEFVQGEFLVKFKPGTAAADRRSLVAQERTERIDEIAEIGVERLRVPPGFSVGEKVNAFSRNPNVEYAEPNYIGTGEFIPDDLSDKDWGLLKIQAPDAWDISRGSRSVVVAVIDSGVRADHEDLGGKIAGGGYNFVDNNTNTSDAHGHGTLVAGIVGAQIDNGKGLPGMAPESPALVLRISDSNNTFNYFSLARAILYAAGCDPNGANCGAPRANVINMSLGGTSSSSTLADAVNKAWNKGIVMVAATGNQGATELLYPARYARVIGVGGTDKNDSRWTGSNTGDGLDVVAPAVSLYSTERGGSYKTVSGTSGATPYVAGLAALILSVNPSLTPTDVRAIIRGTADDLGPSGTDSQYGYGRINAGAALRRAAGVAATSATATPTATPGTTASATATPTPSSDQTAPTVSISRPAAGSSQNANVRIEATASDNVGVTKVEFLVDGGLVGTVTAAPYEFRWDSKTVANGSHTLSAKASDAAANVGTSAPVAITVDNSPPTVSISAPASGATVSGTTTITAQAADNVGVERVLFLIDGTQVGTDTTAPFSHGWDTRTVANGSHQIQVRARDVAGNVASASITVVVNNP